MKNNNIDKNHNAGDAVDDQELLRYLRMEMSADDEYAFELRMEEDAFLQDAVEGLEMTDESKIPDMIAQVNSRLKKQVRKKRRRDRTGFHQKLLIWIALVILLLFVFAAWWVIQATLS